MTILPPSRACYHSMRAAYAALGRQPFPLTATVVVCRSATVAAAAQDVGGAQSSSTLCAGVVHQPGQDSLSSVGQVLLKSLQIGA